MDILLKQPYSFCQKGRRPNQEDARYPDTDAPQDCRPAFVVCDGVGGHDKGEVASRTVADTIGICVRDFDFSRPFTQKDFGKVLEKVYSSLYGKMTSKTREMATTMTFVCFSSAGVFCAHMGDSRIYQIRPGVGIMYRSEDHSLVNALVHSGNLTPEEAIDHPKGNVITRCVSYVEKGMDRPSATTVQIADVEAGDYFFLCSDGVLHEIDDAELVSILSSDMPDREKIRIIAEKSKDSSDNNTAYLIGVEDVIAENGDESDDCEVYDETAHSSDTAPIRNVSEVAVETYPELPTPGKKLKNFFKGLFK